jgi:predicted ABC-type ATPase
VGRILVLAGTNGSGKTTVAGALLRAHGGTYFNPDEVASTISATLPSLPIREANSLAWHEGKRQLEQAIESSGDYNFESARRPDHHACSSTRSVPASTSSSGTSRSRASSFTSSACAGRRGGHVLSEIRERYDRSRINLIELMPGLAELRVYDNSKHADLAKGEAPQPRLILAMTKRKIVEHCDLATAPTWAKPILAAAFAIDPPTMPR